MGTFCIHWMFSYTDSIVKTNTKGQCTDRNCLLYIYWIRINWSSIIVTGISGTIINMPDTALVSIFTDNDLTHITDDHFEIKLVARLLDQMYVIPAPVFPPRYDDTPPSAPQFLEHLHPLLTHS